MPQTARIGWTVAAQQEKFLNPFEVRESFAKSEVKGEPDRGDIDINIINVVAHHFAP